MKLARDLNEVEAKKVQNFILFGGVLTTLTIWTKLEDPINIPKMFILVLLSAITLGLILRQWLNFINLQSLTLQLGLLISILFFIGMCISTFATDVRFTALFGEYHRNNGAISYLSFLIIFSASIFCFHEIKSKILHKHLSILGLILSIYGLIQYLGQDFIFWNNQYNPLITTLGNPNFTSSLIGISAIATTYLIFENKDFLQRAAYVSVLILNLYIILKSDSSQGLFVYIFGAGVTTLSYVYQKNSKLGIIFSLIGTFIGSLIVLAIFNFGPLASRLYQNTLRNRVDYWNAALNMFQSNPAFGIGIDRYGEYYRQYAVQNQYSHGVFTSNAHNVYLQILSTGGLILFIPYLILILFISWCAFNFVSKTDKASKLFAISISAIWVSFLILNIITIDNLGVGIWFWIIGGALVSYNSNIKLQIPVESSTKNRSHAITESLCDFYLPKVFAFLFLLATLSVMLPVITSSSNALYLKSINKSANDPSYISKIMEETSKNSNNPQFLTILGDLALQNGNGEATIEISKKIRAIDERSYYGNYFPILVYEGSKLRELAIPFREKLLEIDKWNTGNMIELIRSYLELKDYKKAAMLASKIEMIYPGSEDSKKAQALIENMTKP